MTNDNNIKEPCKHEWADVIASEEPMTNQIRLTGTCTKCKERVTVLVNKEDFYMRMQEKTFEAVCNYILYGDGGKT